jgi:F-type H+-transporting ATPase subunit O
MAIHIISLKKFAISSYFVVYFQTPIQVFGIEGRYATALYSAATKSNKLDGVEQEMKAFKVGAQYLI